MDLKKKGEIFENNSGNLIFVCCICNATNVGLADVESHLITHLNLVIAGCTKTQDVASDNVGNVGSVKSEPQTDEPNKDLISRPLPLSDNVRPAVNYGNRNVFRIENRQLRDKAPIPIKLNNNNVYRSSRFYPLFVQYTCDICNKKLNSIGTVQKHMKTKHTENLQHNCYICKRYFADGRNLKNHVLRHKQIKEHICIECGKAFVTENEMKRHRTTHLAVKNNVCSICGTRYGHISHLTSHEYRAHGAKKKLRCEHPGCNLIFNRANRLEVHKRRHTGEKPLSCDICKKDFANPNVLRTHKLLHSLEKKYQCKFCPSKFAQSSGRRGHERRVHGAV